MNLWLALDVSGDAGGGCDFEAEGAALGARVFLGNLSLVVGILSGIFLVHVFVVSGFEAYWLSEVRLSSRRLIRHLSRAFARTACLFPPHPSVRRMFPSDQGGRQRRSSHERLGWSGL